MKLFRLALLIMATMYLSTSCRPSLPISQATDTKVSDKTETNVDVKKEISDAVVKLQLESEKQASQQVVPDSVNISTPPDTLITKYAVSVAFIKNGKLNHQLWNKDIEIPVRVPNAIVVTTTNKTQSIQKDSASTDISYVPVPIKCTKEHKTWYEPPLIYSGLIAWFIVIIYLLARFTKIYK